MPLVIFNFFYDDLVEDVNNLSGIENEVVHTRKLHLPREAMDARWKLVAVNANFNEDNETDWISLDVHIPELMTTQNVLLALSLWVILNCLRRAFGFIRHLGS